MHRATPSTKWTRMQCPRVLAALVGVALLVAPAAVTPALAEDAPLVTLFDLSRDDAATGEIAFDVARALKRSKQVRYRDIDESLNVGGEDLQVSAVKSGAGLMKTGTEKLKAGNYEDAADDLDNAVSSYLSAFAHMPDTDPLARAMSLQGVAQLLGGDTKGATASFSRSTQLDPKYEQDFTEYPPKVQQLYDAARKAVLARAKVDYEIRTDPPNARVYVNGRYMGLSPTYVSSLEGEQFISIAKNGYARKAKLTRVDQPGVVLEEELEAARRKPALENISTRLMEVFDGAVEPNDLTEAQGLVATPYAVALRATGSREKMKIELALANLAGRQVVNRVTREISWMRRDKEAIDALVADLLKTPDVPIDQVPQVQTRSVFKTWWFWTVIGGVAVGSTAAILLASESDPVPPTYAPGTGGLKIQF
jgi:hypothetical protein